MSLDKSGLNVDDYYMTALHIFNYFGAESTSTLRVDLLMEKFAPFVNTNKAECNILKSLLDPNQDNPEISVTMLADTLHKYSENHEKVDLDESFNLIRSSQMPHDSDSGISTDGFQLLEELQCELKEKAHTAQQLRSQLEFADRQHEEALAALTAERDSLKKHLNILREENMNLCDVKRDFDEACDRLVTADRALEDAKRDTETLRRRNKVMIEQVSLLETEKVTLQEQLSKSKAECHRMNERYAARQSALLEQNEALSTERADLLARLQDQEEFVQQMIKEKVHWGKLEIELGDMMNRSNQTQLRLDRSIDVSYTDEQMLTALDTLNADSKFSQENRILDEDSFINALKEDQGRITNISLFDEIRLSLCNKSRNTTQDNTGINGFATDKQINPFTYDSMIDMSYNSVGIQTGVEPFTDDSKAFSHSCNETQTEDLIDNGKIYIKNIKSSTDVSTQTNVLNVVSVVTQTVNFDLLNNNNEKNECIECEKRNNYTAKLERDVRSSNCVVNDMQLELAKCEGNLNFLQKLLEDSDNSNQRFQLIIKSLHEKITILETSCTEQREMLYKFSQDECVFEKTCDVTSVHVQTDIPCQECEKRKAVARHHGLRKYFWTSLKSLFQIFALLCFICAISILYQVTTRARPSCPRDAVPWRWMDAQEIFDLLLRIEYGADVPM